MILTIKCPSCRARNTISAQNTICRRCESDLKQLFLLKLNSYKHRVDAINAIFAGDIKVASRSIARAKHLSED